MPGFYFSRLPNSQEKEYAQLLEERWCHLQPTDINSITVSIETDYPDSLNGILRAGKAVIDDHPELFYLNKSLSAKRKGLETSISVKLLYSQEQITFYKRQLNAVSREILTKISHVDDLLSKEQHIYEYLQANVTYTKDNKPERYNIIGALIEKKAVCSGISKAFAVLCHQAGIKCICVYDKKHMWNIVSIHNNFANVDPTYGTSSEHDEIDYSYLNITDIEMGKTHQRNVSIIPGCNSPSLSYYHRHGLVFSSASDLINHLCIPANKYNSPLHIKLLHGDVREAIRQALGQAYNYFRYTYNSTLNTAIITKQ